MCSGTNFFQDNNYTEVYHNIIQQFIALLHKDECNAVFQQDSARPHMVKDTMSFLAELFGKRICKWLPHSPDLSPSDFFFVELSQEYYL